MNPSETAAVRVAFLGATGRSGSTLVSRVLGSLPGVVSVGELVWIWTYGVKLNRPCGCGEPFDACPFWSAVGQRGFGGWAEVDADEAIRLRRELTSNARVPGLIARPDATSPDVAAYLDLQQALYGGIHAVTGGATIVDNSKQAGVALLARRVSSVDLRLVHLVRRSHAVAYSWTKHVPRPDKDGREMRRRSPGRTALRWTLDNALFETVARTGTPTSLVRYEDFVAEPRPQTRRLAAFLDVDPESVDGLFVADDQVSLATDHSVWGNPMRMRSGPETLRADEAWRTRLPAGSRRVVTAVSWPALVRHGYRAGH